jgi:murein DD-endopeptidase MepM/ murein hydrolase activator NlpD
MLKIKQIHLFPLTLLAAAALVGVALWRAGKSHGPEVARTGFQGADVPLGMPVGGGIDFRFQALSAWQQAMVPQALRWDWPLGAGNGALAGVVRKFQAVAGEGEPHAGIDLVVPGGPNVSLGEPVRAAADGLVVFAGEPAEEWGGVVILAHALPEGGQVRTLYGHLGKIEVVVGSLVARGGKIGTVGTANGHHDAHLHFEVIEDHGVDIGTGAAGGLRNRVDPEAWLAARRQGAPEAVAPAPLARLLADPGDGWTELEIRNSERLSDILGKPEP